MICFSQIPFTRDNTTKIYNLASYIEGFERIPYIDPSFYCYPLIVTDQNEREFDEFCAQLWRSNPDSNRALLRIMIDVYNGVDVIILFTDRIPYAVNLIESLSKYIQEIYGVIPNRVNTVDDIPYVTESVFSIEGVQIIDEEIERYRMLYGFKDLPNDPPEELRYTGVDNYGN